MKTIRKYILTLSFLLIAIPMMGQQQTIIVGYGETFEIIARKYGISVGELIAANPGKDKCFAGMEIIVPYPEKSPVGDAGVTSAVLMRADSLLLEAKAVNRSGNHKKAIKLYNKVIDMKVRMPYAYAGRGECYFNQKKYKKAKADLNQALNSGYLAIIEKNWCEEVLGDVEKAILAKRERRNETWSKIGLSFAAATALAANMYVASEQSKMQNQSYQRSMSSNYGTGSSHLSNADRIINQSNAQINSWRAQNTAQLNQMTQSSIIQLEQSRQRLIQSNKELLEWCEKYRKDYGREPTLYEQDQWYGAHYPDLLESRIMARGKMYSDTHEKDIKEKAEDDVRYKTDYKEKFETRYSSGKDCVRCLGSGKCQTCNGNGWYYNPYKLSDIVSCPNCDHNHNGKCSHCHGMGKNP